MYSLLYNTLIPFFTAAFVAILITIIAERYGTKTGGIIGTLPSTIIIAFLFIALDKGTTFAAQSVAVVPAEMGINLVFLLVFALLASQSTVVALLGSFSIWILLTVIIVLANLTNIVLSLTIFVILLLLAFFTLDKVKNITSVERIKVHYTPLKILFRGIIAGTIITLAVTLSNVGEIISGIFSVFPVIFLSTMLISMKEHGPLYTSAMAKGMIFGSPSVVCYAICIYFFYPLYDVILGSIGAFVLSLLLSLFLFFLRKKIM